VLKSDLRKKYLKIRRKLFKEKLKIQFSDIRTIMNKFRKKNPIIGGYYPVSHEIDCLKILQILENKKYMIALPVIKKNYGMEFYRYSFKDPLKLNSYGIPEPLNNKRVDPDILFVPLLAFDKFRYRLGYGGGFYDRYLKKLQNKKNHLSIGFAYSFQITKKIPIENFDKSLDLIITEKKIYK
tara:strand:- start:380 stop:925 length:546 start_codon:yes stop_codon:yes gene_type:complete